VAPGDRVVQVSENRYEWIVLDLAIHLAQAVHVAIHSTLSGAQMAYQIRDSGAQLAVLSTPEQAAKIASAVTELPSRYVSFRTSDPRRGSGRAGAAV
jgi:long-chain acyl-CoA synthetase